MDSEQIERLKELVVLLQAERLAIQAADDAITGKSWQLIGLLGVVSGLALASLSKTKVDMALLAPAITSGFSLVHALLAIRGMDSPILFRAGVGVHDLLEKYDVKEPELFYRRLIVQFVGSASEPDDTEKSMLGLMTKINKGRAHHFQRAAIFFVLTLFGLMTWAILIVYGASST